MKLFGRDSYMSNMLRVQRKKLPKKLIGNDSYLSNTYRKSPASVLGWAGLCILALGVAGYFILPAFSHLLGWGGWSGQAHKPITIQNTSNQVMKQGYTITDDISSLAGASPSNTHIVYWNGNSMQEIDSQFIAIPSIQKNFVRFATQTSLGPNTKITSTYYIYYGNQSNNGKPKSNLANIYLHYTDFTKPWDSTYWGSQPDCATQVANGVQFTNNGSGCSLTGMQQYGTGYAVEYTLEDTALNGVNASKYLGFINSVTTKYNTQPNTLVNLYTAFNGLTNRASFRSIKLGASTYTSLSPALGSQLNTFYVYSIARPSTSINAFSINFSPYTINASSIPADNEYPYIGTSILHNGQISFIVSQYTLRYAVTPEPSVTNT